jgi:DNA polymerase-3 subunit delta'
MVRSGAPHAVLLVGPPSSGKTTLALDLAAGLLCTDPDPAARPCRNCRGCRHLTSGNHPDLHRLAPEGPGGQVRIGAPKDPDPGTVRHLIGELALLAVEGGARVAIVEQAHRLNEDAQNALLKLLEEPPPGVTVVLCADDEERLLPTVRSRCVRIRLGVVAGREIERWLGELGAADPPRAARLARLASGRPGLALAYARSADAERLRGEIARGLLDMLDQGRQQRLTGIRDLLKSSIALGAALSAAEERSSGDSGPDAPPAAATTKRRKGSKAAAAAAEEPGEVSDGARASASDRRSAAAALMEIWAVVGRDLLVAGRGDYVHLREIELLDDVRAAAPEVRAPALSGFLALLTETARRLDENLNPELALDVLALAWPRVDRPSRSAAARAALEAGT